MNKTIKTKSENCIGCNRCVRECPMEMANITYQDENGKIKVKIDDEKCIACGRCVMACKHNARDYKDDTGRFFSDLKNGTEISLIAAPSIKSNFPEWKRILTFLKRSGVNKIYDVSLGADICIWAHVRYTEKTENLPLITQPCPAIVTYCEAYRHDLLNYISPVQSPMACAVTYMRKYEGINNRIAALSPCIAKSNEFAETNLTQYNITFSKLKEYFTDNEIELPEEETGFDHQDCGLGSIFSMPGGLKENIEFFTGKKFRISKTEGFDVYNKLDEYAAAERSLLPDIFDVLNCEDGCNSGPASTHEHTMFEMDRVMNDSRMAATENRGREYYENVHKKYDGLFDINDFLRGYSSLDIELKQITEAEIQEAFVLLGKNDYAGQNIDCGACGSKSCHNMARKIALNINIPENCIVKAKEDARTAHIENINTLEQFGKIWNNVESGIAIIDAGTRKILEVNPVAVRMYGGNREDIIGMRCQNIFCTAEKCPIMELKQDVDRSEKKFRKINNEIIPIIKSVAKIHYNGQDALLESFVDISYIKEAEERMRVLEVAEQASRAKGEFLSKMSHEIRTPMNAIIGMTQIAARTDDVEKLKYCISMINNSSTHLLGLINDVLDMSKIEANKLVLENSPINIETVFINVSNLVIEKVDQKNIDFKVDLNPQMRLDYIGDGMRLSQVLTNLMSNAVKFTPEKGKIRLSVEEVSNDEKYSVLRFSVRDTGIGMTSEQMQRLFNAFEQADSSIARNFGGTGLGLAIAKNIVEKMDGRIWAASEIGRGSEFIFEIKLEKREETVPGGIYFKDTKVLMVSNDKEMKDYFKKITGKYGIFTDSAENGDRAAELIRRSNDAGKPYSSVFVEINSKGTGALDVIGKIRNETGGNTGIIVLASFTKWNSIENEAHSIGVETFLSIPLFPSTVMEAVNVAVSRKNNGGNDNKKDNLYSGSNENTKNNKNTGNGASAPDFSDVSLLLAEDVDINREIFAALLEDTGVNIDFAENGRIAVELFNKNPEKYNMIIMDLQMPEMDGLEAARAIRAANLPNAAAIPIIAMTANAFREDVENCLASGMNDHLAKPIDADAVISKIALYRNLK